METAKIISTEFSTADADCPEMQLTDDILTLSFKDWQRKELTIIFEGVAAFKWQTIEAFIEGEEYDRCHEIDDSSWLSEHLKQQAFTMQENHKHYKFNFNACGQLEVLAIKYDVIS
jgi:hypothetical protein